MIATETVITYGIPMEGQETKLARPLMDSQFIKANRAAVVAAAVAVAADISRDPSLAPGRVTPGPRGARGRIY